jgi:hypothetical protein
MALRSVSLTVAPQQEVRQVAETANVIRQLPCQAILAEVQVLEAMAVQHLHADAYIYACQDNVHAITLNDMAHCGYCYTKYRMFVNAQS